MSDLVGEGAVAGGDAHHGNVVEAGGVGDGGRRDVPGARVGHNHGVHLGIERTPTGQYLTVILSPYDTHRQKGNTTDIPICLHRLVYKL